MATYSFTAALTDNGSQYRAVLTNGFLPPDATTNAATLTIGIAPAFTSVNAMTIPVGLNSGMTVTATGTPAPTLAITSGSLPSSVTFNPTAGLLSGTAAAGTSGTYPVTISATNGIGGNRQKR
jgi:hypothetical protein